MDPLLENREICDQFDSRHEEANECSRQEQLSSEFTTTKISPNQGVILDEYVCVLDASFRDLFISINYNQLVWSNMVSEDSSNWPQLVWD